MPETKTAIPNTFCWVELNANDVAKAKKFYTELFGWGANDITMPDGSPYTILTLGERHVGALTKLSDDAKKMGAPPNWLSFVAVTSADESASKAKSLGGTVVVPPMEAGPGRFAILQDPAGATLALWQQHQSMGTFVYNEVGSLCWSELVSTNVDASGKFHANLFGWKTSAMDMGPAGTYTIFKGAERDAGGMMGAPEGVKHSAWLAYFAVADCDATVAKAEKGGAKVLMAPADIPNVGRFSVLSDPDGAVFAVIKLSPR
jgi:predicted enzyme related to lactoylglutathione lyase